MRIQEKIVVGRMRGLLDLESTLDGLVCDRIVLRRESEDIRDQRYKAKSFHVFVWVCYIFSC